MNQTLAIIKPDAMKKDNMENIEISRIFPISEPKGGHFGT